MALESDLDEGTEKAKTRSQAKRKASLILKKWLREPTQEQGQETPRKLDTSRGFKDPAAMFKKE